MSVEKWIPTGNILINNLLKEGVPKGKSTLIIGESGVGNSYLFKMQKKWVRSQHRKVFIKKIFKL
jgi:ABC-type transporter Mla maintaining outer membrane lipid asymmetry ATPase subunit MlaF